MTVTLFTQLWTASDAAPVFYVAGKPVFARTIQTAKRGNFATLDNEYTACLCTAWPDGERKFVGTVVIYRYGYKLDYDEYTYRFLVRDRYGVDLFDSGEDYIDESDTQAGVPLEQNLWRQVRKALASEV